MFDNPEKLFILFVIALMIFGPSKLASLGASLGRSIRDFRSAVRGAQEEFRTAVQEHVAEVQEHVAEVQEHVASLAPALPAPEPLPGEAAMPGVDYGAAPSAPAASDAAAPAGGAPGDTAVAGVGVASSAEPAPGASAAPAEDDLASLASEPTAAALRDAARSRP